MSYITGRKGTKKNVHAQELVHFCANNTQLYKKNTRVESCGETISVEVIFISKPTRLVGVFFGNGTGITN